MLEMTSTREQRIEQALFRGDSLTLENPEYALALRTFTDALLRADLTPRDLTVEALELENQPASGAIVAREPGVAAGLDELAFMLRGFDVHVQFEKKMGKRSRAATWCCAPKAAGRGCFRSSAWASTWCNA